MKTVIFDVDGVLLSEKRYFDVSALTVWEWYYSPSFMNLGHETVRAELTDEEIDALRARFWLDDAILIWLKKHGVNSNWDMTHAHIVATLWMLGRRPFAGRYCHRIDGRRLRPGPAAARVRRSRRRSGHGAPCRSRAGRCRKG